MARSLKRRRGDWEWKIGYSIAVPWMAAIQYPQRRERDLFLYVHYMSHLGMYLRIMLHRIRSGLTVLQKPLLFPSLNPGIPTLP
jgi:hypothetical protein